MSAIVSQTRTYAYYRKIFQGQSMPLAFVDLDLFDENTARLAERAGCKTMRVASKSVRSVGLLQRILGASPKFQGVMCYSGWEAVFLSGRGFDDLLVAYPIWGASQIVAVCEEIRKGKRIALMIDSPDHAVHLGAIAKKSGVTLPLCMDLDMSSDFPGLHFGVRRSPITTAEQAVAIFNAVQTQGHLSLDGIMGYEAQIAGLQDKIPGQTVKSAMIRFLKGRSVKEITERRASVVHALADAGCALKFVNGGGTGSLETTREEECVTEVTAGSGFYSPTLFDGYVNFRHLPSAGFAIEITRIPAEGIYTCHGGGYIASGSAGKEKLPRPYLPEGAELIDTEGAGEVQTPIVYRGAEKLSLGEPILMRHAKAGELCERFLKLLLISDGKVAGETTTYRGDGQCFV